METPEQSCAESLASQYLPRDASREDILRVLRIAYLEGYTAALRESLERMPASVEFPIRGAA